MRSCPNCGMPIRDSAVVFCPYCGASVPSAAGGGLAHRSRKAPFYGIPGALLVVALVIVSLVGLLILGILLLCGGIVK